MTNDYTNFKILAVDDIPTNTMLLQMMLEQPGYRVLTSLSAEDAVKQVEKEKPDLLLLDVLMPGTDGFTLAKQLKQNPEYSSIPIIFLTALNSADDIVKGFQLGADDYITKPFKKEELLIRVRHQLSLLQAKRTIEQQKVELEKTIAGRDALYSVIAHDLRMPMSTIKMILNVLAIQMSEEENVRKEIVESIQNANEISEQLFRLLDNLLKWTKAQLGKLKAIRQPFDLTDLTEAEVETATVLAANKNITIRFNSTATGPTDVEVDIDMIKTVMRNLMSNAIKYSYRNGTIDVTLETENDEVIYKVIDRGCGISEENQRKLLDLGSQHTTYGTEQESGSGLGLKLVDNFLKLNNGRFFFHSKENEGSTFGFALPVLKKEV
jgi:two-component system sensor histidine kinase/response regulator